MWLPSGKKLPDESTFSRAFAEFAKDGLAERAHAALVKETLGERLVGHISRDGTAIEAREKPKDRKFNRTSQTKLLYAPPTNPIFSPKIMTDSALRPLPWQ